MKSTEYHDGAVIGWSINGDCLCHYLECKDCVDMIVTHDTLFALYEIESPTMPKHLEVDRMSLGGNPANLESRIHCISPCKVEDVSGAHLCIEDDNLYVEIGDKRYPYIKAISEKAISCNTKPAQGFDWIYELLEYPEAKRPEREKIRNWLV